MQDIPGYRIRQQLYASSNSLIYRAERAADGLPVILKIFNQEFPSPERIAWFKREYEVIRNLDLPGVVAAYELENVQQRWMMALEDFGGESLHRLGLAGKLDLAAALKLAIAVAETLGQVHQRYIMHKDVNPSNIVLNPATGQVKLIDFGISTVLSRETPSFRNPNVLEGTLAYISPEQTGRMNRDLDYRTDFYSLGVTLYELLVGRLPFEGADALELVHSHIAKLPPPPHALVPALPATVSAIVMKLLAKNAEDRYQSAAGLAADLAECLAQWQARGQIEQFPLGRHDSSDKFQIPQKLYGRQRETAILLEAFERASRGASELLLVSGYAGVGKSALVHEIYKPITERRGYFIAGKYDQLQRDIPYSAFIQAFRSLVQQLLTESDAAIAAWRAELLAVLGPNAGIIVDVIPEVGLILGPQPAPASISAGEAQHRFRLVFQHFIKVWMRPEHPLVIFLDDLQWADLASLQLLESLTTAADRAYLLILGAYRDNEVGDSHPLMLTLAQIIQAGTPIGQIAMAPLELVHTTELLADTLHQTPAQVGPLAELVHGKTQGNPYFMGEFLKSLYVGGLLTYGYSGGWGWDVARIQERGITDNVVELLADKVQTLPEPAQRVLRLAACIGNEFDLATLVVVSEQPPAAVVAELWRSIAEGLVLPRGDAYKLTGSLTAGASLGDIGARVRYRFAHDRVQQAVYTLIPDADRHAIHWRVGQLRLRSTPPERREEQIFELVTQLNHGVELLGTQTERDELAALNLVAARRAKQSAAYQPALTYARLGCGLLDADAWQRQYDLALGLHMEAAEAAYLNGDEAGMVRLIEVVLQHATALLDRVAAYEVMIRAYRSLEATPLALDVLRQLGISFPDEPAAADLRRGLADIQAALAGRSVASLAELPRMADPLTLAAMNVMAASNLAIYTVVPPLFPLYVIKQVLLSIAQGNAPHSPYSYALYGLVLCAVVGDLDTGYEWGQLGLRLLDTLQATQFRAKTLFTVQAFIHHWKAHAHETLALGRAAYQSGLEAGDLEFVALGTVGYAAYGFHSGKELPPLEREIAAFAETVAALKQETSLYRLRIYRQAIMNLFGQAEDVRRLRGEIYDVDQSLAYHIEQHDGTSAFAVYLSQLMLCLLFHDTAGAIANAELAEQSIDLVVGQMVVPVFFYYDSLARLASCADASPAERDRALAKADANQAQMATWAAHAPMNFQHRWHLAEAERARVQGRPGEAREHYDRAAELAHQHGYLSDEALAYELAGRFYLARGQAQFAQVCLHNAHYAFRRWGATAKVRDLEARYPELFTRARASTTAHISTGTGTGSGRTTLSGLDVGSVVKASQVISGEIVLSRLLETLITIVLENAGAQQGSLLLETSAGLTVAATGSVDQGTAVVVHAPQAAAQPDAAALNLPLSIVNYVARTHESVVLHDAAADGAFAQDAYIAHARPKSVLCAPLLKAGRLLGILYLENNLTAGAFTPERLEVLQLLAAQMAISIENASLYDNLRQSERKYRALFEDSRDAIFISGPGGEILDINPATERLFGFTRAELLRMNTVDFYASADDRRRLLATIAAEGAVRDFEAPLRRRDGSTVECVVTAAPRYADDGTSLGFQGIIRDMTEQRRSERERGQLLALQRELDVARHIQASLLPPAHGDWPELDAVCYNAPAREVGGDFYAYHARPAAEGRRRFAFALGDVTDKGVPAALLMAISMTSFQAIIGQSSDPGALLRQLDAAIARYTRTNRQNCALVYVEIEAAGDDPRSEVATLRAANAGCVPPLIRRAGGAVEWVDVGGLPLGTALGRQLGYASATRELARGDMVILTSDGVVEATSRSGELLGFERLERAAADGPATSAEAMLTHLRALVDTFVAGGEPHDDVTIVVIRV
jgi:PAS domain S-box-containing protein